MHLLFSKYFQHRTLLLSDTRMVLYVLEDRSYSIILYPLLFHIS